MSVNVINTNRDFLEVVFKKKTVLTVIINAETVLSLIALAKFVWSLILLAWPLVVLVLSLVVLHCPLVVLVYSLVVPVCPLVALVCPFVALSVGLFITDRQVNLIKFIESYKFDNVNSKIWHIFIWWNQFDQILKIRTCSIHQINLMKKRQSKSPRVKKKLQQWNCKWMNMKYLFM